MKKERKPSGDSPTHSTPGSASEEFQFPTIEEMVPPEELEQMSALQLVDFIRRRFAFQGIATPDMDVLRRRIEDMEVMQDEARDAIEKLGEVVDKLKSPALRLGTLIERPSKDLALVCANGTDYVCSVNPEIEESTLETGCKVLLNEAFAVTDAFGFDKNGPVARILELMGDGRLRVGNEAGISDLIVSRSSLIAKEKLKQGIDIRLDSNQRVAIEVLGMAKRVERTLSAVEPITWNQIGGQHEAVEAIRDSIELPLLHAHLFERFNHPVPKGFLLFGPPGCGKTLLGKATAHNLRLKLREKTGEDRPEFFLNVKGPEILNMWLGESERQIRDLFSQCREKAAEGSLAFLFIDEAESILGTRHAHRVGTNILSTLVPMFCTEMDGLEALQNVVIILASNRADLIDPAILRPGRIDRKIRVQRPNEEAARDIYRIYLSDDLPLADTREALIDAIVNAHYGKTEENKFLQVTYRSGRNEFLYRGDLASGAIIAGIVERAKEFAIKRSIKEEKESPLTQGDLLSALEKEYHENDLFPPSDITEDWLKLTDFDPSNVVRLSSYRSKTAENSRSSMV